MPRKTLTVLRVLLMWALLLAVAACGGDDTEETAADAPDIGDVVEDADEDAADVPERIISLSPSLTEMLFAIGAGEQVEAVDEQSDFPDDAPTTDLSGFEPNVEAIVDYDPDLVLISNDIGDVVAGLDAAGVETLLLPAAQTLQETYDQIEQLGGATGHVGDAAELVSDMKADIDDLATQVPERDEPLTYYHELDPTYFSVTSKTFLGELYALAGLENIADAADTDSSGYPQLSAEHILEQDPDLIFLADTVCCQQDADAVAARPGWSELSAVQNDGVVELDDDIASRWGPRVVELLRTIVKAVSDR